MHLLKTFAIGFGVGYIATKAAVWAVTPGANGTPPVSNPTAQQYAVPLAAGLGFVLAHKFLGSDA